MGDIIKQLKEQDLLENDNKILYSLLEDKKLKYISGNMPSFYEYGKKLDKTSYLSWKFNFSSNTNFDFDIMADAYYECTMELIGKCYSDNSDKKMDMWIFPILYNAGHSIELKLKSIYSYLFNDVKANHNWINLVEKIEKFYIDKSKENNLPSNNKTMYNQFLISLKIVKEFLTIFLSQTCDITFARYPVNKKMKEFFYNNSEENVVIDLTLFRNEYVLSYYLLNFIVEMIYEECSNS